MVRPGTGAPIQPGSARSIRIESGHGNLGSPACDELLARLADIRPLLVLGMTERQGDAFRHNRIRAARVRETGMWLISADVTGQRDPARIGLGPTCAMSGSGAIDVDEVFPAVAVIIPPVAALGGGLLGLARGRPGRRLDVALFYAAWAFGLGALGVVVLSRAGAAVALFLWAI
jgi:hypothetical protein